MCIKVYTLDLLVTGRKQFWATNNISMQHSRQTWRRTKNLSPLPTPLFTECYEGKALQHELEWSSYYIDISKMSLTCKFVVTLVGSLVRILTFFVYYCWMRNLTSRQNPIFRMRESFILTMLYKLNGPSLPLFLIREKKRIGKYLFRYPACITKMETLINREISQIIQDCFLSLLFSST